MNSNTLHPPEGSRARPRGSTGMEIHPTGFALGADIHGANLREPSEPEISAIRRAIDDHLVVRLRGYTLKDLEFVQFAQRFGELDDAPDYTLSRPAYLPECPQLIAVSNVVQDGKVVGEHGDGELNWHTDLAFTDFPAALTFLLAREVPSTGGNTSFANMYCAFERIPQRLLSQLSRLKLKHQSSHNAQGGRRPGYQDIETDDPRELPGTLHPILRTHPSTGRKSLYLAGRFGCYIPGLPLSKSDALVDELWSYAARPEDVWTQEWQVGDIIIWDNRCTMHRRDAFAGQGRRLMFRLFTKGERPS